MTQLERTLFGIDTPGVMARADQLAVYRELGVNARSEARGRLRTEWLRLKNHLELMDEREGRTAGGAS